MLGLYKGYFEQRNKINDDGKKNNKGDFGIKM
jgi:hypothetical protein